MVSGDLENVYVTCPREAKTAPLTQVKGTWHLDRSVSCHTLEHTCMWTCTLIYIQALCYLLEVPLAHPKSLRTSRKTFPWQTISNKKPLLASLGLWAHGLAIRLQCCVEDRHLFLHLNRSKCQGSGLGKQNMAAPQPNFPQGSAVLCNVPMAQLY